MVGIAKNVCCVCILLGNISYYFFSLETLFKKFKVHAETAIRSVTPKPVRLKHKVGPVRSMTTVEYP
jgi:hypothetical protein